MQVVVILLCLASGGFAIYEIISFIKMIKKLRKSRDKPLNTDNK